MAIKRYQTEGVYHGKRDIHRRPFEVCAIPEYQKDDPVHQDIVKAARAAQRKMDTAGKTLTGGLAKVREQARSIVAVELSQIDGLVKLLLVQTASKNAVTE